jgi:hypothetical protein
MQVIDLDTKEDTTLKLWTDEEDSLLLSYRLNNKSSKEIGKLLHRSEFTIDLRLHLLIYRFQRNGLSASEIRLKTNADLSQILDIIKPVQLKQQSSYTLWNFISWLSLWK